MDDLRDRIVKALDDDQKNEVIQPRLELRYSQMYNAELAQDLRELETTYEELFGRGIVGKDGGVYEVRRTSPNQVTICRKLPQKPFPAAAPPPMHNPFAMPYIPAFPPFIPLPPPQAVQRIAKPSEIYEACNHVLEAEESGMIPLDLLEEKVEERLHACHAVLGGRHVGEQFVRLVSNAGHYIQGVVDNGRLCRQSAIQPPPPSQMPSSHVNAEPPPPYRPPSVMTGSTWNGDSMPPPYSTATSSSSTFPRFSGPGMRVPNTTRSSDVSNALGNLDINAQRNPNLEVHARATLREKYLTRKTTYVVASTEEEAKVQKDAKEECEILWNEEIDSLAEFLYILKHFWIKFQHKTRRILDIRESILDNTLGSNGKRQLDWKCLGDITADDLIRLQLLTLVPPGRKHVRSPHDMIEVNPCVQMANFFQIDGTSFHSHAYKYLNGTRDGQTSIADICRQFNVKTNFLHSELGSLPAIFSITQETVRLNKPLPFFVILK